MEWRPQCCGDAWPNTCVGKPRKSERPEDGVLLSKESDKPYVLRGMWAHNYWLFCDKKERLVDEHASGRRQKTLKVGNRGLSWDLPSEYVFEVLGYRFHRDGVSGCRPNVVQRQASWWRDGYKYWSKSVPTTTKCRRVLSHVCCTLPPRCMREKAGLVTGRGQQILSA